MSKSTLDRLRDLVVGQLINACIPSYINATEWINDSRRIYSTELYTDSVKCLSQVIRGSAVEGPRPILDASIFHYQPVRLLLPGYRSGVSGVSLSACLNALIPFGRVPSPIGRSLARASGDDHCRVASLSRLLNRARSRTSPVVPYARVSLVPQNFTRI